MLPESFVELWIFIDAFDGSAHAHPAPVGRSGGREGKPGDDAEEALSSLMSGTEVLQFHTKIEQFLVRGGKQLVSLGNAADPEKLLNEMNAIWNPEVNVYFELGRIGCGHDRRAFAAGRRH